MDYLRTGHRHRAWPNQYKTEFAIFSSLNSFILLQLILFCIFKEHRLNCLLFLLLHIKSVIYHLKRGLKFVSEKILQLNSPPLLSYWGHLDNIIVNWDWSTLNALSTSFLDDSCRYANIFLFSPYDIEMVFTSVAKFG